MDYIQNLIYCLETNEYNKMLLDYRSNIMKRTKQQIFIPEALKNKEENRIRNLK